MASKVPDQPSLPDDDQYGASETPRMPASSADKNIPRETTRGLSIEGFKDKLTSDDIVIAVMGVTGVGKSTFISYFSQTAQIRIGRESCTIDVVIHKAKIGDQRCFLIDTPGFDGTHRSDTDVLRKIADWLNRSYQAKIQLAGIVYLHRIIDLRVGGSFLKNLLMFMKLCGAQRLPCVVFATTMWSQVTPEQGERRENELISNQKFWGEMIKKGITVMRQDQAEVSAIQIIQYILSKRRRMVLDIQEEMVSGKTLDETSAGRELEAELERMRKKHEGEMKALREDMLEAQIRNDKRSYDELAATRANLQKKMDQDRKDRERMRVTIEELRKQRDAELRAERRMIFERQLAFQKEAAENAQRMKTMQLDSKHKLEITKSEYDRLETETENAQLRAIEAKWGYEDRSLLPTFGGVLQSIPTFSAKATRPTESMETVTPVAFQTLEEFLDSIPGIQTQKRHGGSESRDQLRRVVGKAVTLQLKILDPGDESWLTELVGQNHSGEDNAQFIAKLLVEYALNRPWVLHNGLIKGMMASTDPSCPVGENIIPRFQHSEICTYHMLHGDLNKFLIDHKDNVSSNQWIVRIGKKSRDLILLPGREIELEAGMTTDLDSLLGMAGFVPIFPTIPGITIDSVFYDYLQDQALSGFQSHVNFEKTGFTDCARVSYFRDESEIPRYAIFDAIECFTRAAIRVETAVHRLQRRGRCHRLFFLRRPLNLGTGSTEADSNSYIEATSVELNVLQNFLEELRQQKYQLERLSCVLPAIEGTMALVTGSLSLSPTIFTLATTYQSTTDQDPSRQELLKLLPLAKAIAPILSTLGISGPDLENDSFLDLLHYAALAVQFLALVVQSYARRFTTPMDFSFLDYPISNFVLEGASFGNTQEKIFARSQELSCLGDMIGSHVLVFGKDMSLVEKAVDVDITAADLIEIWGPAKLAVVQKNNLQPARITGVEMLGGILSPNNRTTDEKVLWHWERIAEPSMPDSLLERTAEKGDGIHLNTRMRVGATGQIPLNSTPEGWKKCPRADIESDLELRKCFRQSLSHLGAQDPALELKSTQAGLQGGQFVVPQLLWTWERSPGRSVKWNLLYSNLGFDSWIAELDNSWGLLVSLCTGVMKRARLRDLIAFVGPCSFHELIPTLPGFHDRMADDDFARIFSGREDLKKWIDGIVKEYCERKIGQSTEIARERQMLEPQAGQEETLAQLRAALQEQIHTMIKAVLKNLQYTGVFRKDHLALAWMSPGQSAKQLRMSCQEHVWTRVLTDSSQVATFGCIGPFCFETPECPCRGTDWNPPKRFQLLTEVAYYTKYYDGTTTKQFRELQLGRSYWINTSDLNLLAKVLGMKSDSKSNLLYYYLLIKESLLDAKFRRHLDVKHMIREEDNQGSFSCVIGSGEEYKMEVKKHTAK